jgi:hypothetical protein
VSPTVYHVPLEYIKGKAALNDSKPNNNSHKESPGKTHKKTNAATNDALTVNSIEQMMLQREAFRHSQELIAHKTELPNFASLQFPSNNPNQTGQQKPSSPPNSTPTASSAAPAMTPFNPHNISSYVVSPTVPESLHQKPSSAMTANSNTKSEAPSSERIMLETEFKNDPVLTINRQAIDDDQRRHSSSDEHELQFPIETDQNDEKKQKKEKQVIFSSSDQVEKSSEPLQERKQESQPASSSELSSSYSNLHQLTAESLTLLNAINSGQMKVENPNQVVGKPVAQASAPLPPAPAAPVHQSSPARRKMKEAKESKQEKSSSPTAKTTPRPVSISNSSTISPTAPPPPSSSSSSTANQLFRSPANPRTPQPMKPTAKSYNYCTCLYCQTFSLSLRLQKFPMYECGMEDGSPYARSSRVLSWMSTTVTPRVRNYISFVNSSFIIFF